MGNVIMVNSGVTCEEARSIARRAVAYNDCRSVKLYFDTRHFSITSDVSFCKSGP